MNALVSAKEIFTMRTFGVCLTAFGVLALGAVGASAQNAGAMLARADANGDGAISLQEMQTARAQAFTRMDRNGDGQLAGSEVRQQAARADRNSDGVITRAEFVDGPYPVFERYDANRNNVLDAEEIETARAAMQGRGAGN
jgi:EF hand